MMTSAAEMPSSLWISTGMPRPLSVTVTEPVGVQRHRDDVGMARKRLVDGVVDHLIDHVMQARAVVGVADIHAGALAHRIQAFENLDGIGAIGGVFKVAGSFVHVGGPSTGETAPAMLLIRIANIGCHDGFFTRTRAYAGETAWRFHYSQHLC
jgi:hypothetical protein